MSTNERAEVLIANPGRKFITLKIITSDGVTGLGDAILNGRGPVGRGVPEHRSRNAYVIGSIPIGGSTFGLVRGQISAQSPPLSSSGT